MRTTKPRFTLRRAGIEDLREKREEVNRQILRDEEEKAKVQRVRVSVRVHGLRWVARVCVVGGCAPVVRANRLDACMHMKLSWLAPLVVKWVAVCTTLVVGPGGAGTGTTV